MTEKEVIRQQVRELWDIRATAQRKLEELQQKCDHSEGTGIYKANTGNWCPQDDCYWIDFTCSICNKWMHIDSEREAELYRKLSRSGMVKHG